MNAETPTRIAVVIDDELSDWVEGVWVPSALSPSNFFATNNESATSIFSAS